MKIAAITTFSDKHYDTYARDMVRSWLILQDVDLYLGLDWDLDPDTVKIETPQCRLLGIDVRQDKERNIWLANAKRNRHLHGNRDYQTQAVRFSHKVWALTTEHRPEDIDWWIWVDADTTWHKKIDWTKLLPKDKVLVYLGREHCKHKRCRHSECGFVAYKVSDSRVASLLDDFRHVYTSGEIEHLPQRHDSFVFDHVRRRAGIPSDQMWDMSSDQTKELDVWDHTILREYGIHHKGIKKFRR